MLKSEMYEVSILCYELTVLGFVCRFHLNRFCLAPAIVYSYNCG